MAAPRPARDPEYARRSALPDYRLPEQPAEPAQPELEQELRKWLRRYHEASHCVVGHVCGMPIEGLSARRHDAWCAWSIPKTAEGALAYLTALAASACAQRKFGAQHPDYSIHCQQDRRDAASMAAKLPRSTDEAWRLLDEAERYAQIDVMTREIDAVISTGARVRRQDWDGLFDEVLDMSPKAVRLARVNQGAPVLDSHNWTSGVGATLGGVVPGTARLEDGALVARIKLSRGSALAQRVAQDLQDGIQIPISAGYKVRRSVSDRSTSPATRTAVDWEPIEVSLVPVAAEESGTGFRRAVAWAKSAAAGLGFPVLHRPVPRDWNWGYLAMGLWAILIAVSRWTVPQRVGTLPVGHFSGKPAHFFGAVSPMLRIVDKGCSHSSFSSAQSAQCSASFRDISWPNRDQCQGRNNARQGLQGNGAPDCRGLRTPRSASRRTCWLDAPFDKPSSQQSGKSALRGVARPEQLGRPVMAAEHWITVASGGLQSSTIPDRNLASAAVDHLI
jgi:hypothetical protein